MNSFVTFFTDLIGALEEAEVPYMLTGSLVSSEYSKPRSTEDIDVIIEALPANVEAFVKLLDADRFYVGDHVRAIENTDQFNVVEPSTGWKLDLIVRDNSPFSISEFQRRQRIEIEGVEVSVATVEDLILSKLMWAKLGESERQLRDVSSMIEFKRDQLDTVYLNMWADELGVSEPLEKILAEYPPSNS